MVNGLTRKISSLFNVEHLNEDAQYLLFRYLSYASLVRSFSSLSSTFLILYVLDAVGFTAAGVLVAIRLIVQAVFDYPTGILSDWLGQRLVLILSYISFGIAFLVFSFSAGYYYLLLAYVFYAFGTAQESGTLISWFDNNYRFITKQDDPTRSAYRSILGKFRTIVDLFGAVMLIVGGWIATTFSRELVFQIQVVAMVIIVIVTFQLIYDFDGMTKQAADQSYFSLLKEGVVSIFRSKLLTLLVAAGVIYQVGMGIFGNLIIFPIYFGYTGTDFGASIFRFSLFVGGSAALWLVADYIGSLRAKIWLPRIHLVHTFIFYGGLLILFQFFPLENKLVLGGILIAGLVIFISHMLRVAIGIFQRQIFLDIIPDHRRNGFYSFKPTLILIIQAPFVYGSGSIIEEQGFTSIIIILGMITLVSSSLFFIAMRFLEETHDELE